MTIATLGLTWSQYPAAMAPQTAASCGNRRGRARFGASGTGNQLETARNAPNARKAEGANKCRRTSAQFVLRRLHEHGISQIYGYPGDGINGLLGAFHEHGDEVEFIQTRHEEIAAFCATAHAKLTDEVGVCMATSGPGAIHLLNGLYDAKLDHQPVVAIVGQQKTFSLGSNYQQEVDLVSLFKDVASEFVQVCMSPPQARHLIDRAVQVAKASRSVTAVIIPEDVQESDYSDPPREHGADLQLGRRQPAPARDPAGERDPARRPGAQRGGEGGDADRPGRRRRARRGDRGGRPARRRRRQGAQRAGRAAGRSALRDRLDRPARHQAELRDDLGLRHPADGRLELPLRRVASGAGQGARRPDRHRRAPGRDPVPDGGQPGRRLATTPCGS